VPAKADRATVKFEGTTETRSQFVEWPLPARPAPKPFVAAALQVRRETHGEGDRERREGEREREREREEREGEREGGSWWHPKARPLTPASPGKEAE
jgi:mannosyltransferase OCH1-like enzyme